MRAVVQGDGGDYARVKQVTIGFQAVSSILSKRVDAVPAFWNAEGVALRERGVRTNEFRVEDYGAPPYPEVVLVTARSTLRREPKVVAGVVAAIGDGVNSVLAHPEPAAREIAKAAGQADLGLVRAQLRALRPVVVPPMRLDRGVLERWAPFDARFGIVPRSRTSTRRSPSASRVERRCPRTPGRRSRCASCPEIASRSRRNAAIRTVTAPLAGEVQGSRSGTGADPP